MAKKTFIKVRMVPESKPDSPYFYYLRNLPEVKKRRLNYLLENTIKAQENTNYL